MIDLRRLRDDAEYREGAVRKGADTSLVDEVLAADAAQRIVRHRTEELRATSNTASREIGRAAPDERAARIEAAQAIKADLVAAEEELAALDGRLGELALQLPNPAAGTVPVGGEDDYAVVSEHGGRPDAPPMTHAEFAEAIGFVDTERAVRMSGSRFAYLTGPVVQIQFALVQWVLGRLVADGFVPVVPPVLVREQMMVDAGFFPTDRNQVYELPSDELDETLHELLTEQQPAADHDVGGHGAAGSGPGAIPADATSAVSGLAGVTGKKQAAAWSSVVVADSSGRSCAHASCARGQRVRNAHPLGGSTGDGTSPVSRIC